MGMPQVPGQLRRAPTLALRAVFAGIGRILMSADRPQATISPAASPDAGGGHGPRSVANRQQRPVATAPHIPNSRWRSLDETGNVRLLSAGDLDDNHNWPRAGGSDLSAPGLGAAGLAATTGPAPEPAAAPGPALPLANYDELTLASIRARLRGLDTGQLRILADYELRNAERPEVLGMFERRIEKLEAGG